METKYITIPFDFERAKRISNGEEDGKIVTRDGRSARIVCWDRNYENYPIVALVKFADDETEDVIYLTHNGYYYLKGTNNDDLLLSVPEWTTFKDGDVYKTERGSVAIFNGNYKAIMNNTPYYVGLRECDGILIFQSNDFGFGIMSKCTLDVSEEDKQKLIDALKASDHPLAKKYLKRFFNYKEEHKFEPGQPVIGIDGRGEWRYDIFSHYKPEHKNGNYVCSGRSYSKCLPYNEQTKHLLGTTKDWEE